MNVNTAQKRIACLLTSEPLVCACVRRYCANCGAQLWVSAVWVLSVDLGAVTPVCDACGLIPPTYRERARARLDVDGVRRMMAEHN